jgi:hypothetical protein
MSQGQTDLTNRETNISVVIQTITDSISKEIEQLGKLYVMRDAERVLAFYAENRFLFDLLIEAPTPIKKLFGEETELGLRVALDSEAGYSEMFIRIMTKLKAEQAFSLLEKLEEEWWFNSSEKTNGKLNLTLEYV